MSINRTLVGMAALILATGCGNLAKPGGPGTPGDHLPITMKVTCDGNGTEVGGPKVQPQDDGVHLVVVNRTAQRGGFVVENYGGDNLARGENHFVFPVPPGKLRIACGENLGRTGADINVIDAAGVWVSPELDCPDWNGYGIADSSPDKTGAGPIELTRRDLRGLTDQDQLQIAGYPKGSRRAVRVVRDGKVVAAAGFDAGEEGLTFTGVSSCPASGIS
ncbi:MAG: hypothetical protein M3P01_06360 [Actinomycetota bacterium]|nr:hypothetical protein [Actinomycetota bacterium]